LSPRITLSPLKVNETLSGLALMEVTYAAALFVQILVLPVKEGLLGNNLLGHAGRFPRELHPDLAVVVEQIELEFVIAALELDLRALLLHRVETSVVDHELSVDPHPGAVVRFGVEGVLRILGHANQAG